MDTRLSPRRAGRARPARPDPDLERQAIPDALSGIEVLSSEAGVAIAARFGTLRALRCASPGRVAEVDGIHRDLAVRVPDTVRAPLHQRT